MKQDIDFSDALLMCFMTWIFSLIVSAIFYCAEGSMADNACGKIRGRLDIIETSVVISCTHCGGSGHEPVGASK